MEWYIILLIVVLSLFVQLTLLWYAFMFGEACVVRNYIKCAPEEREAMMKSYVEALSSPNV